VKDIVETYESLGYDDSKKRQEMAGCCHVSRVARDAHKAYLFFLLAQKRKVLCVRTLALGHIPMVKI
jgi:hypothetical protein